MIPKQRPASESHRPAVWGTSLGYGQPLSSDDLAKIPIFEAVSKDLLQKNFGAVVRRTFKAGEVICREGEYGSTAFYILSGSAEVSIESPMSHISTEAKTVGIFKRNTRLQVKHEPTFRAEVEKERTFIPIDAPVDLSYANPVAALAEGDLFGEMTCMNFYPRSATVRALTDCTMLEMLRNILDILRKNPAFKSHLDEVYCRRALETHLRCVPFFASLTPAFIRHLASEVKLVRVDPGQVICRQGDPADSFYLVRNGFVKVSQRHAGGDLVVAYLSRGDYFGEIALLGGGPRTATCTSLDHVELVKMNDEEFRLILFAYPEIGEAIRNKALERQKQNRQVLDRITSGSLDKFLAQGLMEAENLLVLDLEKCTRCDLCVQACADSHEGVTRLIREGLRYGKFLIASSCRQCRDPLCMVGCPVGSIRRRQSLEVLIEDWCIGCGLCAKNCPYGNINMHQISTGVSESRLNQAKAIVKMKATTCDLCVGLDEPSCVYACPHQAAHRLTAEQIVHISGAANAVSAASGKVEPLPQ